MLTGAVLLASAPSQAQTIRGADGEDGADGGAAQPGGDANDGESLHETVLSPNSYVDIWLYGGNGGDGGAGGDGAPGTPDGGDGGSGGDGGGAHGSVVIEAPAPGHSVALGRMRAYGGDGGDAGLGGTAAEGGADGASGHGGAGGDATALGVTPHAVGEDPVHLLGWAIAGDGGRGDGPHSTGGVAGAAHAEAHVLGVDQDASATAMQEAGSGGDGRNGAAAAHGGDSVMRDQVSGSTAGSLTLRQSAEGGRGGIGYDGGRAGDGGYAESVLTPAVALNPGGGGLSVDANATGGYGGTGEQGTEAGRAGDAFASIEGVVEAAGDVTVGVSARAGSGGTGSDGLDGAMGGTPTVGTGERSIVGRSTTGHQVQVSANAGGGQGGQLYGDGTSGDGRSVFLENVVDGISNGPIRLTQSAHGGGSGSVRSGNGSVGEAGSATSRLSAEKSSALIAVTSFAEGGGGGSQRGGPLAAGSGADADALASSVNLRGSTESVAEAEGGSGGSALDGSPLAGDGGAAHAVAYSETAGSERSKPGFYTEALARARGGNGGQIISHGLRGGDGAKAVAEAHGRSSDDTRIDVMSEAQGGKGGEAYPTNPDFWQGTGGDGGDALATALGESTAPGLEEGEHEVSVHALARAGWGARGYGDGFSGGSGANAIARAASVTRSQRASVLAEAFGADGHETSGYQGGGGHGGNGLAEATAFSETGSASASAYATGGQGFRGQPNGVARATAEAKTAGLASSDARIVLPYPDGGTLDAIATTSGDPSGSGPKQVRSDIGRSIPVGPLSSIEGLSSAAVASYFPQQTDVLPRLSDNPAAASAFGPQSGGEALGLVMLGGEGPAGASDADLVLSSEFRLGRITEGIAPEDHLLLGVLDPVFEAGSSLLEVHFQVELRGVVVVDSVIGDAASAASLDDRLFDLGSIEELGSGFSLVVRLAVEGASAGDGFRVDFLFGNGAAVPEPTTALLLSLGLALAFASRR